MIRFFRRSELGFVFGDQALEWLARAIDRYDGGLLGAELPTRKEMDFMRQDPRFRKLMGRMGLGR